MDGTFRGPLLALARALGAMLAAFLVAGAAFAQQSPLRIGFGMSLTGPLAGNGKAALIAMEIWRDDVNAKGGILGRKVEFVYYDDQTNPGDGAEHLHQAARRGQGGPRRVGLRHQRDRAGDADHDAAQAHVHEPRSA